MRKVMLNFAMIALMATVACDNNTVNQAKKDVADTMEQMKEETGKAVNDVQEKVKDFISEIEAPKFNDNEAQKVADDYAKFLKEKAEALKSGSAEKVEELKAKTAEWKTKMEEFGSKLTPEDATKWSEWKKKISEFEL